MRPTQSGRGGFLAFACLPAAVGACLGFCAEARAAGADVFVCRVGSEQQYAGYFNWGFSNGIRAFSIETYACNQGDANAGWDDDEPAPINDHPVIGQNMFRLRNGVFEQIGQAWLKHGFYAAEESNCGMWCLADGTGNYLGPGCCDMYSATLNGNNNFMGPKSEVNPSTGAFPFPICQAGCPPPAATIGRRLQVADGDLDATAGVLYFIEIQYVLPSDCVASPRTDYNNASWRRIGLTAGHLLDGWVGDTQQQQVGILAWPAYDAGVSIVTADVAGDGRYWIAVKTTDLGGGQWHYEYAVQNLNSDRGGGAFRVPIARGATISNVGFRDVAYHSGEPYDNTDWNAPAAGPVVSGSLAWSSAPHPSDPANANALRWGTMYNFRFDANVPPATGKVTIDLFKAGSPAGVSAVTAVPRHCVCDGDMNADGVVDGRDVCGFVQDYLAATPSPCGDLAAPYGAALTDADVSSFATLLVGNPSCPL